MNIRAGLVNGKFPYLKLINRRDGIGFKVEESYILNGTKTIGRGNNNNIIIQDPFMSSNHASIIKEENGFFLKDIGSTNGTYINNHKIIHSCVKLKNGDKIQFGKLTFLFVDDV
jgi:pSer/pThr/pTyr-binding forkhead associated (FHA) protein